MVPALDTIFGVDAEDERPRPSVAKPPVNKNINKFYFIFNTFLIGLVIQKRMLVWFTVSLLDTKTRVCLKKYLSSPEMPIGS